LNEVQLPEDLTSGGLGGFQLRDYLDLARRRKWWIVLSATALFVATIVAVFRMPNIYRSETVILVDPQKVPDNYVPSTVSGGFADRLTTIRQLATSPTRLKALIDKLNLYSQLGTTDPEAAVAAMQRNINVDVADAGGQRLSAFKITFFSRVPEVAASVANELAAMVIQDNVKARQQAATGAEEFLDNQLQETKKQLEDKENEVQKIKTQYVLDLPESKQFHLEALNSLRNQLSASQDRVNEDKQEMVYLQSTGNNFPPPTIDLDSSDPVSTSPYSSAIQKDQARLAELQARYGPQFPDVRKLQNEITNLQAKAAQDAQDDPAQAQPDAAKLAERALHHNPVIEAQLTKLRQEIDDETKKQTALEPQIAAHISQLEQEPIFEQQIAGLMRDYDTLRGHYNSLLDKKIAAEMSLQLETQDRGERFEILDSAPVPHTPASPNRPLFSLVALIGGILGGFALAVVVEMTDESVRNEREAAQILHAPVLIGVPEIFTPRQRLRTSFLGAAAVVLTVAVAAAAGVLVPYVLRLVS
jgi:polysaccharide chain length determinant protein (PEP-CTERM system associated)